VFRPRLIWTIYVCLIVQVFVYSYAVHLFWERYAPHLISPKMPPGPAPSKDALVSAARTVGLLADPSGGPIAAAASAILERRTEKVAEVGCLQLEMPGMSPEARGFYEGRRVKLRGRFVPINDKTFTLVRYRINCCAADAIPLKAVIRIDDKAKDVLPVKDLRDKWVLVTGEGRFESRPGAGTYQTTPV